MQLPPPIKRLPYNWYTPRGLESILGIVGHGTAGEDSRDYLSRGGDLPDGSDRKVSIHVLIDKAGKQYRYVPDERGANHAGAHSAVLSVGGKTYRGGRINQVTLSFELENLQNGRDPYTDDQLLSMGFLISSWRKKHGFLPLFRHGDIDPTRRRDPYKLSIEDMEGWVTRSQVRGPPRYRVTVASARIRSRAETSAMQVGSLKRDAIVTGEIVTGIQRPNDGTTHDRWLKLSADRYVWLGLLEMLP